MSRAAAVVLGGRIVLLLGAAGAVVAAVCLSRGHDGDAGGVSAGAGARAYACPMHPEVSGAAPTACPICGMALEPVRSGPRPAGAAETFSVPVTAQSRLFFDVTFAKKRPTARDMLAPAWLEAGDRGVAVFYNDEIALLEPEERGCLRPSAGAGACTNTVRMLPGPPVARDRSTSAVRFVVTGGPPLAVGDAGWIKLADRTRPLLALPYSAVVESPAGSYVLVASPDRHTFSRRDVQIGRVQFGYVPVLGGLREGERVVAMDTFFLDAERRWVSHSGLAREPAQEAAR